MYFWWLHTVPRPKRTINQGCLDKNCENATGTDETSFAAKTRKSKRSYPFARYILAGSEVRGNLTRPHYLAWEEFIFSTKIKMSVQENSMIKIDFTLFCGNYSLVAFADKSTAKGQLISKCIFGAIVWTKKATKFFSRISALASKKMSNQKNKDTLLH